MATSLQRDVSQAHQVSMSANKSAVKQQIFNELVSDATQ
jgi:hypothetical protein